jgi:hypothetical protein
MASALSEVKGISTTTTPKSKLQYGGIYLIKYRDGEESPYYVFVLHPNSDGKVHCLDLGLIDQKVFQQFFIDVRLDNAEERIEKLSKNLSVIKPNVKISTSFYNTKIKNNIQLTKDKPYKTLDYKKIQTVKFIPYDYD